MVDTDIKLEVEEPEVDGVIHEAAMVEDTRQIEAPKDPDDIAEAIPGLFRVLDLVQEQGSSGLGENPNIRYHRPFLTNCVSG